MRSLVAIAFVLVACSDSSTVDVGLSDAGPPDVDVADVADVTVDVVPDVVMNDTAIEDARGDVFDAGFPPCPDFAPTTSPVTRLALAGDVVLVGTETSIETWAGNLTQLDSVATPVRSLAADEERAAVFDATTTRLFAIDEAGMLTESVRFDASGQSVLALDEVRLFTFRFPLEARINTLEARDVTDLSTPLGLGEVEVMGTGPADVAIAGDLVYALDAAESVLIVVDVSSPDSMFERARVPVVDLVPSSQVAAGSRFVFVGTATSVVAFDVTNPDSPLEVASALGGPLVASRGLSVVTAADPGAMAYGFSPDPPAFVRFGALLPDTPPTAVAFVPFSILVGTSEGVHRGACPVE